MVNYSLDTTFLALADPTRRRILSRLSRGQATVTELAAPFPVSLPAISKHLRVLESAGLLHRDKVGRQQYCRLMAAPMREASEWISRYRRFWEDRLDDLDRYLQSGNSPSAAHRRSVPSTPGMGKRSLDQVRESSSLRLNVVFSALGDPTRRHILERLARGEAYVRELAEPLAISLPAVSKHLRALEHAGLLARQKEGRRTRCRLVALPMKTAAEWIDLYRRFWEEQLDALDRYLQESNRKEDQDG